ncbi:MAG: acyl-CoA dehydrogenase, partial [Tsuneonella sp.]
MTPPLKRSDISRLTAELPDLGDPSTPDALLDLLRLLYRVGRSDLPLGRVFEGHVDALQIIIRLGTPAQGAFARTAAQTGIFGVWNADLPDDPLRMEDGRLTGGKAFASGAGLLSHALVSIDAEGRRQLLLIDLATMPAAIDTKWWDVTGMQRSQTHQVRWDALLPSGTMIGQPGDYVEEPWFSGGALRFAAVQAGGIAGVVDQVRDLLVAAGRAVDP